jgi:hypothetical protein
MPRVRALVTDLIDDVPLRGMAGDVEGVLEQRRGDQDAAGLVPHRERAGVPRPDLLLHQDIDLGPFVGAVADLLGQEPPQDPRVVPDALRSRQAPAEQPRRPQRTGAVHVDGLTPRAPGADLPTADLRPGRRHPAAARQAGADHWQDHRCDDGEQTGYPQQVGGQPHDQHGLPHHAME